MDCSRLYEGTVVSSNKPDRISKLVEKFTR